MKTKNQSSILLFWTVLLTSVLVIINNNGCLQAFQNKPEKINVFVSILPQKYFVKRIGGDRVDISVMVGPGQSPAIYEPLPKQMAKLSQTRLYFSIGVPFEDVWMQRITKANSNLKIIDTRRGIELVPLTSSHKQAINHPAEHSPTNPHIWTSVRFVKIQAQNIFNALVVCDPDFTSYYKTNLKAFHNDLDKLDLEIAEKLKGIRKRKFMVFHPAWGYFAKQYDLVQLSVEIDGKSPKPRALAKLMKQAKKYNVKAIFTQPEFSTKTAQIIAKELNIEVIKVSPIHPHWSENLIKFSEAIKGNK